MAGIRVGELLALRWRDVDLANGRLTVGESKTDAGRRVVDLSPDLRDELATHKIGSPYSRDDELVFPTTRGKPQNRNNIRRRVLLPAVDRADQRLAERGLPPLPERLSPHSLRHTFASLLFEAGATVPCVMAQLGHTDPKVTLSIYAHMLSRRTDTGERLDALVSPAEWPPLGTSAQTTEDGAAQPAKGGK